VSVWRLLQIFGAACLVMVILTHVAERFDLFPDMEWGLPHSPGHYLDLVSAVLSKPGRTEGVRKLAKRFGVNPSTVQRISRPFEGSAAASVGDKPATPF
jgi:hypothetical protein